MSDLLGHLEGIDTRSIGAHARNGRRIGAHQQRGAAMKIRCRNGYRVGSRVVARRIRPSGCLRLQIER
jgi:hypothetical protein